MPPGNDIVDLQWAREQVHSAESRWLNKVFVREEIYAIESSDEPFLIKWLLWSMKETVFKMVKREDYKLLFAPHHLVCQIENPSSGKAVVNYNSQSYLIHFKTNGAFVYSSVANKLNRKRIEKIIQLPAADYMTQSESVRRELLRHYARQMKTPLESLKVIKDKNGLPSLQDELHACTFPVSITHHGYYAAYVLEIK